MRYKRPDKKNALSLLEAARKDLKFTFTIKVSEDSGSPIIELLKLNINTSRPINLIDSIRRLRNNINYYGYRPKLNEVEDVVSIAKTCFEPLYKEVKKIVSKI